MLIPHDDSWHLNQGEVGGDSDLHHGVRTIANAHRLIDLATMLDNQTFQVGKLTPVGITIWLGHNGVNSLLNTFKIASHSHFDSLGNGGQVNVRDLTGTVPTARARHSANVSIAHNTGGLSLSLDTEDFDTDTIHDLVTNNNRLTCKTAGKYLIIGQAAWAANVTGSRQLAIKLNAAETIIATSQLAAAPIGDTVNLTTTTYDLAVNDYVILSPFQDSGVSLTLIGGQAYSPVFSMVRLSS